MNEPSEKETVGTHAKCITTLCHFYYLSFRGEVERGSMIKKDRLPKITIRGTYYNSRTLPSLNDYIAEIGKNPKAGSRMKSDYTKIIINATRRCLRSWKVTRPPVIMHYKYFENKKGKRRDIGNIHALAQKFVEDALQSCGVIGNDNPDWICGFTADFEWIDGEPYVEVIIEERG